VKNNVALFTLIRPWIIIFAFIGGYCLFTLAKNSWDPMSFVLIGKQFDPANGVLELGYDGQFAYQIAINPAHAAPFLDAASYRYQRILYPILAFVLSLGNTQVIPWMLIAINVVSVALGTLATEKLLAAHGFSRWYALAYGGFTGFLLSVRLDLTEPLAFALVQWGVLFLDRKKIWQSLPFFALAALCRELTLLFAGASFLFLFFNGQKWKSIFWAIGAVLPFGIWQLILRLWLGSWGIQSGGAFSSPFEWIPYHGVWGYHDRSSYLFLLLTVMVVCISLLPSAIAIVISVRSLWKKQFGLGVFLLLSNAIIFPFLPTSNILNLPGLVRMTIGLVVAFLNFGAIESSKRTLWYSQLWLLLLLFGEGLIAVY